MLPLSGDDFAHDDIRFAEVMVELAQAYGNPDIIALAYGFGGHQKADWVAHTKYVVEPGFEHLKKEGGVSSILWRSNDPDERTVARQGTVVWNPYLIYYTSAEYVDRYGQGRVIPPGEVNSAGRKLANGIEAANAIIGSWWFYFYALANYPRSEWEVYYIESADSVESWVKRMSDGEFPSPEQPRPLIADRGEPETLLFLAELGERFLQAGGIDFRLEQHDNYIKANSKIVDRALCERILLETVDDYLLNRRSDPAIDLVEFLKQIMPAEQDREALSLLPSASPNPFNLSTEISFCLPIPAEVTIEVYNISGQLVREFDLGSKETGYHSVIWDGRSSSGMPVSSGIYFYRIQAGELSAQNKLLLLK